MRTSRVYVDQPLSPHARVRIDGPAAGHLVRVLRLAAGDALTIFNGRGGEYPARIRETGRNHAIVEIGERRSVERESPLAVTLAQGVSRGERMDLVVQKATELGVRRIVPLLTERSVVRFDANQRASRLRHWRSVAVAACEQCGRNALPEIAAPADLAEFLSWPDTEARRIVLAPDGEAAVRDLDPGSGGVMLLVGPEGGLSSAERQASVRAGYRTLRLGPRVLRTETAAIAALVAVQLWLGDL